MSMDLCLSVMLVFSLLTFFFNRNHFLLMLLTLEMIVLLLYFLLFSYVYIMFNDLLFMMIFLTMSVCEGVLGLSILVMMVRIHGNDYMLSFSFLW